MSEETTFVKPSAEPAATTAVARPVPTAVQMGGVESAGGGAVTIRLPYLRLSHGKSRAGKPSFASGVFVYDDELALTDKVGDPLTIIILGIRESWREYKYTPGVERVSYKTEQEVWAHGGTTQWANGPGPTFCKAGAVRLMIQKPEGKECSMFGIEMEGKLWAPAMYFADKGAYKAIEEQVQRAQLMLLRGKANGLLNAQFILSTVIKTGRQSGEQYPNPTLRYKGPTKPETVAMLLDLFAQMSAAPIMEEEDGSLVPESGVQPPF